MTRFDRSWRALTPTQQRLFAGLSLLAGTSFPRSAALAIATAAHEAPSLVAPASVPAPLEADARDDLAALVAYALVEPLPGGDRLRLHPLLREYAELQLERLPTEISEHLGDAMVAFLLAYARRHPGYDGMDALEAEAPGLMGAIEWAHDYERHRDVLALAKALGLAWRTRGRRTDQLRIYGYASGAADSLHDTNEQQWAAHQLAVLDAQTGHLEEARAGFKRVLALAQQLQDPSAERAEMHVLAVLDFTEGNLVGARANDERALELARQFSDPAAEAEILISLGDTTRNMGEFTDARKFILDGLARWSGD